MVDGRRGGPGVAGWVERVNRPMTGAGMASKKRRVERGTPCGGEEWSTETPRRLGLEASMRSRGRQREQLAAEMKNVPL